MRAIVLSGGGANGAYQIGVWKALKKLKIKYNIVTGTSIGALNGAFMVQKDLKQAIKIWEELSYKSVFEMDADQSKVKFFFDSIVKEGGLDVSTFGEKISNKINYKKFKNSNIDFGLITLNLSDLKKKNVTKEILTKENLIDYLLASSAAFPAFKKQEIEGDSYIDGGFVDNLPINLAIELGATEIIAVDLNQLGFNKKIKDDSIKIKYIIPSQKLSHFFDFEGEIASELIDMGYKDTMKQYGRLDGKIYTFEKNNLSKKYSHLDELITKKIRSIIDDKKHIRKFDYFFKDFENSLNELIDDIGKIYKMDWHKKYKLSDFNCQVINYVNGQESSKFTKDPKKILSRRLINHFYKSIMNGEIDKIDKIKLLTKKEFLIAIYLNIVGKNNKI